MRLLILQFAFILGSFVISSPIFADTGSVLSGSSVTGNLITGSVLSGSSVTGNLITGSILSGSSFSHNATTFSHNATTFSKLDDLLPKIFQINVYKYSEIFDRYTLIQYGSAVLVDEDKLVTNAHVVYDLKSKETYFYQVCKTNTIKDNPICFSSATLVRLDITNDLALLKVEDSNDLGNPVSISTIDQNVGDLVHVLGYPANGGETITVTEGAIAGYSKGYYKIDANLDEGNSGGGAFDANGNLIGIPSFLADGYTSLGYILDAKILTSFLDEKIGQSISLKISKSFQEYLSHIQNINSDGIINNTFFQMDSFIDAGFTLSSILEKPQQNLYNYSLISDDGDLSISLQTIQRSSKTTAKSYTNYSTSYYKKTIPHTSSFSKTIDNNKWQIITTQGEEVNSYTYIQDSIASNIFFEARIQFLKDTNKETIKDALTLIESISFKKVKSKHSPVITPQFQFAGQQYSIFKQITDNGLAAFFVPINNSFYGYLEYADHAKVLPNTHFLSGIVSSVSYLVDGKVSLQNSTQKKPFYTISYIDDSGIQHLLGMRLVKESNAYCSITADLLLNSKNGLTEARKALQSFKVNSINK